MDTSEFSGGLGKNEATQNLTWEIVTVRAQAFLDKQTGQSRTKLVISVKHENEAPIDFTLNRTNLKTIQGLFGRESNNWIAKKIRIFWDAGVLFAGQMVGGARVAAAL